MGTSFFGITAIVVIVFGILQIILFFKLWEMTNNIRRIGKKVSRITPDPHYCAKAELILGNRDASMDIIKRNFIEDAYDVYNNVKKAANSMSSTSPEKDYEIKYNYLLKCYKETYGDIYDESIRSIDTRVLSNYEEAKKFFECSIGKYWF